MHLSSVIPLALTSIFTLATSASIGAPSPAPISISANATNMIWDTDDFAGHPVRELGLNGSNATDLETRKELGVYICSEANWKGKCSWQVAGGGACHRYAYTQASSFGPDAGLRCTIFQGDACGANGKTNEFTDVMHPGLSYVGTWWGKPNSFRCAKCAPKSQWCTFPNSGQISPSACPKPFYCQAK